MFLFLMALGLPAQGVSLSGRVVDVLQQPLAGVQVLALEANLSTATDGEGRFQLSGLAEGRLTLQLRSLVHGKTVFRAQLDSRPQQTLTIVLDLRVHQEMLVSSGPGMASLSDLSHAVGVVDEKQLDQAGAASIGQLLETLTGVHSSAFAPGASRPILRGMTAARTRVLTNGTGSGDASEISPDHAPSLSAANADRIEVLRGTAALRFGSGALGGVVNVIDRKIAEHPLPLPLTGSLQIGGETGSSAQFATLDLSGGLGPWSWHGETALRSQGNVRVPQSFFHHPEEHEGEEEHDEEPDQGRRLENTSLDLQNHALGLSRAGSWGYLGASVTHFKTDYGIPHGAHEHEDHDKSWLRVEEEESVTIEMEQTRIDLRGQWRPTSGAFRSWNLQLAGGDYQHRELEGGEEGTLFDNQSLEGRLEAVCKAFGPFDAGYLGLHLQKRDFEALGEEALTPPSRSESTALYAFQDWLGDRYSLNGGLRLEKSSVEVSPEQGGPSEQQRRDFNTASGGLGWLLRLGSGQLGLQFNLARRAPSAEELFSDGPHLATGAYERGDAHLEPETSRGLEATWRLNVEVLRLEFNLYQNRIADYIYFADGGVLEEGLPLLQARQTEARIQGMELHLDWEWLHRDPYHLDLELDLDALEARDLSAKVWLPRTPPARASLGLLLQTQSFWLRPQVQHIASQSKLAPEEEKTEGYELFSLLAGVRFYQRGRVHEFFLHGENLGDELGFRHQSIQKERMPVAGRSFSLNYKLAF